jgi:hypothetical protein
MEQKNKITSLQELIDWIDNSNVCNITEKDEDYFLVEAPNNADVYVRYDEDDEIEDIISKTIETLRDFDADKRFTEYWNFEFAKQNGFTPLSFITMLKEDEESFRELAGKLSIFVAERQRMIN